MLSLVERVAAAMSQPSSTSATAAPAFVRVSLDLGSKWIVIVATGVSRESPAIPLPPS